MPKFRNITNDDRSVPAYGQTIKSGDVIDVPGSEVDGFLGQDEVWEPLSTQVKHAAKEKASEEVK